MIAYFSKPDGTLLNAGDRLANKPYADFLRRLAAQGPDALYKGSTAARIVARTHQGPLAGSMTMGPNGSGKSTLAYVLAGRPGYEVTEGSASFDGQDLLAMTKRPKSQRGRLPLHQDPWITDHAFPSRTLVE